MVYNWGYSLNFTFMMHRGGKRPGKSGGGFGGKKYGKPSFEKPRFDRGGDRDRDFQGPELYQTTCSDCGSDCEVPFKPNGKKPVLCHSCYRNAGTEGYAPRRREDRSKGRDSSPREYSKGPAAASNKSFEKLEKQFEMLNSKLDQILKALEK
jgi:CxxC-x17-CxxC domain-containing protein